MCAEPTHGHGRSARCTVGKATCAGTRRVRRALHGCGENPDCGAVCSLLSILALWTGMKSAQVLACMNSYGPVVFCGGAHTFGVLRDPRHTLSRHFLSALRVRLEGGLAHAVSAATRGRAQKHVPKGTRDGTPSPGSDVALLTRHSCAAHVAPTRGPQVRQLLPKHRPKLANLRSMLANSCQTPAKTRSQI